jgi:hypothetical protein
MSTCEEFMHPCYTLPRYFFLPLIPAKTTLMHVLHFRDTFCHEYLRKLHASMFYTYEISFLPRVSAKTSCIHVLHFRDIFSTMSTCEDFMHQCSTLPRYFSCHEYLRRIHASMLHTSEMFFSATSTCENLMHPCSTLPRYFFCHEYRRRLIAHARSSTVRNLQVITFCQRLFISLERFYFVWSCKTLQIRRRPCSERSLKLGYPHRVAVGHVNLIRECGRSIQCAN